jgi:hypothetical protein
MDWKTNIATEMPSSDLGCYLTSISNLKTHVVSHASIQDAIRVTRGILISENPLNLSLRWNPIGQTVNSMDLDDNDVEYQSFEVPTAELDASDDGSLRDLTVETIEPIQTIQKLAPATLPVQTSFSAQSMVDKFMKLRGIQPQSHKQLIDEDPLPKLSRKLIFEYSPIVKKNASSQGIRIIANTKLHRYKELTRLISNENGFEMIFREEFSTMPDLLLDSQTGVLVLPLMMASQTNSSGEPTILQEVIQKYSYNLTRLILIFECYTRQVSEAFNLFSKPIVAGLKQLSACPLMHIKISMNVLDTLAILQRFSESQSWEGAWKDRRWLSEVETIVRNSSHSNLTGSMSDSYALRVSSILFQRS